MGKLLQLFGLEKKSHEQLVFEAAKKKLERAEDQLNFLLERNQWESVLNEARTTVWMAKREVIYTYDAWVMSTMSEQEKKAKFPNLQAEEEPNGNDSQGNPSPSSAA